MPPSLRALLAATVAALVPASDPGPGGATWKAGVARAVVTPKTGVWLAGYGTKRAPTASCTTSG